MRAMVLYVPMWMFLLACICILGLGVVVFSLGLRIEDLERGGHRNQEE